MAKDTLGLEDINGRHVVFLKMFESPDVQVKMLIHYCVGKTDHMGPLDKIVGASYYD